MLTKISSLLGDGTIFPTEPANGMQFTGSPCKGKLSCVPAFTSYFHSFKFIRRTKTFKKTINSDYFLTRTIILYPDKGSFPENCEGNRFIKRNRGKFNIGLSCLALLLFFSNTGAAQIPKHEPPRLINVIQSSPQVSQIQKYGDYPVTHYSGIPEINLPIYTVVSGKLSVPISLSYHASGLKSGALSGIAGMGWSLTGGGQISRTVIGKPDEYATFPYPQKTASQLTNSVADKNFLENLTAPNNLSDSEYDVFSFSTPTANGKFVLKNTGDNIRTPVTIPFNPVRISSSRTNFNGGEIQYFEITDDQGILYRFGKSIKTGTLYSEFTNTSAKGGITNDQTGWFLTEMISADKTDTISFKYKVFTQFYSKNSYTYAVLENLEAITQPGWAQPCPVPSTTNYEEQSTTSTTHTTSTTRVLEEINFRNGKITFSYVSDPGPLENNLKLSLINIYNGLGSLINKYQLIQSVYSSNAAYYKLDRLDKYDALGQEIQKHTFEYNQTSFSGFGSMSNAIDHWGYYNGQTGNINSLTARTLYAGPLQVAVSSGSANREANETSSQAGILTKITYPTGGSSSFFYEGNKAPNYSGTLKNVGGLRIKKIENKSADDKTEIRTFKYGTGENGIGQMLNDPYIDGNFIQYSKELGLCRGANAPSYKRTVRTINSEFIDGTSYFESLPVFYNLITEYNGDGVNNNGKTEFAYRSPNNAYYNADGVMTRYIKSFNNWTLGLMVSKSIYRNDAGTYTLIQKENYSYSDKPVDVLNSLKAYRNYNVPTDPFYAGPTYDFGDLFGEGDNAYSYLDYKITTGISLLIKKEIENKPENVVTTEVYKYNNLHNRPIEIVFASSLGDSIVTRTKYPTEYPGITANDAISMGINTLLTTNKIDVPVEQSFSRKVVGVSGEKFVRATFNSFKPSSPVQDKIFSVENNTTLSNFSASGVASGAVVKDSRYAEQLSFDSYDVNNNLLQQQLVNGPKVSYKWGYKNQYPIAEIKNSAVNEFYSQNFEEPELGLDFEANVVYDNTRYHSGKYSGRIINPNATEFVSHSSKRLNISLAAPKKFTFSGWVFSNGPSVQLFLFMMKAGETGYNTYYDHIQTTTTNKWVYVKKEFLVPADVVQMFLRLDNNAAGTVWFDDLRIQPSDASMTTYTYDPLVGMTSAIDDSGKTVYYEYDTFQRLMLVKDQNGDIIKKYDYHYKP